MESVDQSRYPKYPPSSPSLRLSHGPIKQKMLRMLPPCRVRSSGIRHPERHQNLVFFRDQNAEVCFKPFGRKPSLSGLDQALWISQPFQQPWWPNFLCFLSEAYARTDRNNGVCLCLWACSKFRILSEPFEYIFAWKACHHVVVYRPLIPTAHVRKRPGFDKISPWNASETTHNSK
jgi:hypothetical protein